jgi:hypothetical protein
MKHDEDERSRSGARRCRTGGPRTTSWTGCRAAMPFNRRRRARNPRHGAVPKRFFSEGETTGSRTSWESARASGMNSEYGDELVAVDEEGAVRGDPQRRVSGMCLVPSRVDTEWWTAISSRSSGRRAALEPVTSCRRRSTWWLRFAGPDRRGPPCGRAAEVRGRRGAHGGERRALPELGDPAASTRDNRPPPPPRFVSRPSLFGGRPLLTVGMPQ